MSRKISPRSSEHPYHVCARTNNREWFKLDLDQVWEIFEAQLFFIHHAYGVQIHAFVLMTNHFHLLMSDPQLNMDKAMRWLMTETSREIGRRVRRKNRIWGQRNFKCLIESYHYYLQAYKYIYRNPVEAGAVSRPEDYKYSTLNGLLGFSKLTIPICEDPLLEDLERHLEWLNQRVEKEDWNAVGKALRKSQFRFVKDRKRNLVSHLEQRII